MMFAFEIQHLPADHAVDRADCVRDEPDNLDNSRGRGVESSQHFEGARLQGVAGQNGDGFSKCDLWQVGLPRRRSSLSSAGRSSWISE
jgi:hypothetical protein